MRLVKSDHDFDTQNKGYVQAQELSDFWVLNEAEEIPDIILVEYPAAVSYTHLDVYKRQSHFLIEGRTAMLTRLQIDNVMKRQHQRDGPP